MVEVKKIFPVAPGTLWEGSNRKKFAVTEVVEDDQGIWVHYEDVNDKSKKYNCLIDSFTGRFSGVLS